MQNSFIATEEKIATYRTRIYENYRTVHNLTELAEERNGRAPYLRNMVFKHLPKERDAIILDLGCGSGTLLHFLQEAGYSNVFGIDTSPEQVLAAKELGMTNVEEGDLFETLRRTKTNSLDVVIAFDVIEHLTKPELLEFADEVYRVLSSRGRWLIHAPNAESPFGASVRYADWTHEQAFTRRGITQLLNAVGFAQIQCFEDQPIAHGIKSRFRLFLWQIIRTFAWTYLAIETGRVDKNRIFSQNLLAVAFVCKEDLINTL